MYKRKGFTLIELLVVIAIIALLMSMLMPALTMTRKMTRASMCMSNLKQWGAFFSMYTDDYGGKFMGGRINPPSGAWWVSIWWYVMEPYYRDRSLLCCPMANDYQKSTFEGYENFGTWGAKGNWFPDGFYGSYGINEWVNDTPTDLLLYGSPVKFWRSTNVKGQGYIPLLGDGQWDEGWCEASDWIPSYPGEIETIAGTDVGQFALIRHDGYINMLFMDYSVKKLHIRKLWGLRWHRLSHMEADEAPTEYDFPDWLRKL